MDTPKSHTVYRFQGFALDVEARRLSNQVGDEVKLSSRGFDILVELLKHRGEILSKDYLMDTIWPDLVVEENNINQAIRLVRKALGDSTSEPVFIRTVSGKGFCFIAEVQRDEAVVPPIESLVEPLPEKSIESDLSVPTLPDSDTQDDKPGDKIIVATWHSTVTKPLLLNSAVVIVALVSVLLFFFHDRAGPTESEQNDLNSPPFELAADRDKQNLIPDSIAVLPFSNLNQDAASDLFVLGLHDELINQLAKVKNLKVISRDSITSVAEKGGTVFEIADYLNVESLVTGSILVMGDQARINLQMLNADTGVALWGESYEVDTKDLSEMIATQGAIALKVVKALEVEVMPPETKRLALLPTQSFEAYRYYLTARNSYMHQDNEEKFQLVRKALELDPEFADALLMFASINAVLSNSPMDGYTHQDHLRMMLDSVQAFIEIAPERTEGYALKALALGAKRDWIGMAEQLAILKQLGASDADMKYTGVLLISLGDFQGAVDIYEDSLITEPANLYSRGLLMAVHEMAGHREQARQEYVLGKELKSVWWGNTVNILLALGRKEPLDVTADLVELSPELIHVLNNLHQQELVTQGLQLYLSSANQNSEEDVFYSALAALQGNMDLATTLLRNSMKKVSTNILWAWLPVFDELRRTEEFRQLLMDFGLVAYWRQHGWPEVCQPQGDTFSCDWVAYSK